MDVAPFAEQCEEYLTCSLNKKDSAKDDNSALNLLVRDYLKEKQLNFGGS